MGGNTLPNIKVYYTATLIKALRFWYRDRHIDQWNRKENPEIDPPKCAQLIFDKSTKAIPWRKDSLLNKQTCSNCTSINNKINLDTFYTELKMDHIHKCKR